MVRKTAARQAAKLCRRLVFTPIGFEVRVGARTGPDQEGNARDGREDLAMRLIAPYTLTPPETWPSGLRRRFAKSLYLETGTIGSNPIVSAIP